MAIEKNPVIRRSASRIEVRIPGVNHFPDIRKMVILPHQASSKNSRYGPQDHFAQMRKMVTIKAKDFANEITNFNIKRDGLRMETGITKEHVKNNQEVRKLLIKRNIKPDELPPAEDVKKIERKFASEQKKLITKAEPLDTIEDKSQNTP